MNQKLIKVILAGLIAMFTVACHHGGGRKCKASINPPGHFDNQNIWKGKQWIKEWQQ